MTRATLLRAHAEAALARLFCAELGVRGTLNSTYEDECLPEARELLRKLRRKGWQLTKIPTRSGR